MEGKRYSITTPPCPARSLAGRSCQGKAGHNGKHWCCYPGGTDRWSYSPEIDLRDATRTARQLAELLEAVEDYYKAKRYKVGMNVKRLQIKSHRIEQAEQHLKETFEQIRAEQEQR